MMLSFGKAFLLVAVVAQFCAGQATEFTAFCDVARLVNAETTCPADLSCADVSFTYDGVTATCTGTHISSLKASDLKLASLPESLNNMTSLQILNVASNELTALPVLGGLKALKTLYLYNNKLTTITGIFPNSPKLDFVAVSNNALTELPPEFALLKIKTLNFDNNDVEKLPAEYKNITSLRDVGMAQNKFDCDEVRKNFADTLFATECIQAQQRTEDGYPALPTSFSTEPPNEGLDAFEITALVLMCVFVVGAVVAIVMYVRYRKGGLQA